MTSTDSLQIDPALDLVLERVVDVSPQKVWAAWTQPEHVMRWFAPRPWSTPECTIDLRPGGAFTSVMRSPEGDEFPNVGCYPEVVPNERLVWTNGLLPGYRPVDGPLLFTAAILIAPSGAGTRYTAIAMHREEAGREQHEAMGFHEGWGTVLDQLVEYINGV